MRNNEEKLLRDIQYEINCYLTTGQLNSLLFILFLIPRHAVVSKPGLGKYSTARTPKVSPRP